MSIPKYGFRPKGAQIANIYEIAERIDKDERTLIDKIISEFVDRSRKDIRKWREAQKAIEDPRYPNRTKYHDLNADLIMDLHLESQIQIRILSSTCNRYRIMNRKTGEMNQDRTREIRTGWFRELMYQYLFTSMDGTAVLQARVNDRQIRGFDVIPKRYIIPERKEVTTRGGWFKGIRYRGNPDYPDHLILELGKSSNPGLMLKLSPNLIWKRNALQAWADYGQLFGKPYRKATTRSSDKATLDRIEYMMKKMGSAGYGIYPEGTTMELVADGQRDAYQVFDAQVARHNSEISKAVNGVTMLSDDGSSRSQSQVHYQVNGKIIQADMEGFESYVNEVLVPNHLIPIGYRFSPDDEFEFDMTESLGVKEHWEIVQGIISEYDVNPQWISKTFGVPILGKKEVKSPFDPAPDYPANQVHNTFMPDYPISGCCSSITDQEAGDEYTRLLGEIAEDVYNQELEAEIPKALYLQRSQELLNAFSTGFKDRLNVDWNSPDNYKIALYQANIFRFSAAGTWQDVQYLNELRRKASNSDEFKQLARQHGLVVNNHIGTEYNTCESVAQNGANWLRQQEDAEDYDLMYQTAGDSNVRAEHRTLDGYTAPVDDPVWDRIYPPNAWNCRCEVVQVPAGSRKRTQSPVPEGAVQKGFDGNRGKLNTIFKYNESYLKEFPDEIDKFNRKTYGLDNFTQLYKGKRNFEVRITEQTDFVEQLKAEANRFDGSSAYYKDFLGRHFEVSAARFKNHFKSGDKQERWSMLHLVKEILATPDEVWMYEQNRKNNRYSATYIKAFKNKALHVVVNSEEEGKLKVLTWYAHELNDDVIGNDRKGIMIKAK